MGNWAELPRISAQHGGQTPRRIVDTEWAVGKIF